MIEANDELVVVRRCSWLHEAYFIRSVLATDGIVAFVPDEYLIGVEPFYGIALGGVRVQVRASDLDRARQLLDGLDQAEAPE